MNKVIIDVTQLMQWSGRLTGVPRVTYELVSRFIQDENSVFVTWHGYDFCEINRSEIFKNRQTQADGIHSVHEQANLKKSVPNRVKTALKRFVILKKAYHAINQSHAKRTVILESSTGCVFTPEVQDIFFIAEGIWSDERYIDKIIAFKNKGVKIVQISYDLLPIVTPQYSGHSTEWLKNYANRVYPICDLILSISEHTKKDITAWLKTRRATIPTIRTFRLGENFKFGAVKKPNQDELNVRKGHFLLCVGTMEARKNHTLLYYVYKKAISKGAKLPELVIVGRRGWHAENIYDLIKTDPDIRNKITILENCSDEELAWLYRNCLFTIYPSFYEGWGLPIAESMYCGVPCLSSNTSSMPEVAGELAYYFDPTSPDDALEKIKYLLDENNLNAARRKAKRYKATSWDDTYEKVKKYIMELL